MFRKCLQSYNFKPQILQHILVQLRKQNCTEDHLSIKSSHFASDKSNFEINKYMDTLMVLCTVYLKIITITCEMRIKFPNNVNTRYIKQRPHISLLTTQCSYIQLLQKIKSSINWLMNSYTLTL